MSTLMSLLVKLGLDAEDFLKGLGGAEKQTEKFSGGIVASLAKIGGPMVLGAIGLATVALAGIGASAFAAGMQMDEAYDTIAIGTGKTGQALTGLQNDFKAVFKDLPGDSNAAAAAITGLNRTLGVSGDALTGMAKPLLEATRLLGGDAKTNTQLFSRVMGDWSINVADGGKTLDKLFTATQLSGVGMDALMGKVVQFGSPLRLMGFTLDDSISLFAKWEKEGVNAELVMGSLRIAAGKFAQEAEKGNEVTTGGVKSLAESAKKLDELQFALHKAEAAQAGFNAKTKPITIEENARKVAKLKDEISTLTAAMEKGEFQTVKTAGTNKSLRDSLLETFESIQKNTNASEALALGMEVFGARAGPDMVAAIREGRFAIDDMVAALGNSEGAILRTAAATADWPETWAKIKNTATVALEPLGTALMGMANTALQFAGPALTGLAQTASTMLIPVLQTGVTAVGSFFQTFTDGGDILDAIANAIGTVFGDDAMGQAFTVMEQVRSAFEGLTTSIQIVVGAVQSIIREFQGGGDVFDAIAVAIYAVDHSILDSNVVMAQWRSAFEGLTTSIQIVVGAVQSVIREFQGGGDVFDAIAVAVAALNPSILNSDVVMAQWRSTFESVVEFLQSYGIPILAGIGAMILAVVVPAFIAWATTVFTVTIPAFVAWAIAAATAGAATIAAALPMIAIIAGIGLAVGLLVAAWMNDWGGIRTTLTAFWNETAQPIFAALVNWFTVTLPAALTMIGQWFANTWASISAGVSAAWTAITEWIRTALTNLGILFDWALNLWLSIIKGVLDLILGIFGTSTEKILATTGAWLDSTWATLSETWDRISGFLGDTWNTIVTTIGAYLERLRQTLDLAWTVITSTAKAAWTGLSQGVVRIAGEMKESVTTGPIAAFAGKLADTWEKIRETATRSWTGIKDDLWQIADGMWRSIMEGPIGAFLFSIRNFTASVRQAFTDMLAGIHISTPHINVSWQDLPVLGHIPSGVSVEWYGRGGEFIANSPMIIGVGERGPERVSIQPAGQEGSNGRTLILNYYDQRPSGAAPDLVNVARDLEWQAAMRGI